ncbi:hypothetical protein [Tenacibaculum amylolyticum]|uniref:hypothetical protein n=1 Tax=Tenacibaculum amylolyticum TaxID=104269 RepID=UPI00389412A7
MNLEELKIELEKKFPKYEYNLGKRGLGGECVIVKNTKYSGVDIFLKKDTIVLEAAIPEMKTRLLLGAGVLFLKMFSKKFNAPSKEIHSYFKETNRNVRFRS